MHDTPLFSKAELRAYCEHALQILAKEIDELPPATITGADPEQLTNYFIQKYTLTTPTLDESHISIDQEDTKVDVSQDPYRMIHDRTRPFLIPGTTYTYYVPFTGDADLLQCRPSQYNLGPPAGAINEHELVFTYDDTRHDANAIKAAFARDLASTKSWLLWVANDVNQYNQNLPGHARARLHQRREKLMKDQQLAGTLGYPLRRRPGAPSTYTLPIKKKTIPLPRPTPAAPEPALSNEIYEDILSIIQNMALVLERSPAAFKNMQEPDLRTHFLVQLNGQYEGAATGETFNASGKTDILIRHENKNLFIAECKFWDGPKSLTDAIDQLLGYTTWRDTKTAILLFNRNKNFTNVLQQIPGIVQAHPNFIQRHQYANETGYRCTMRQEADTQRHFTLTILAFDIPT